MKDERNGALTAKHLTKNPTEFPAHLRPQGELPVTYIKTAILTGGNGYIGSVLLQRLVAEGVEVHAITHRGREKLDKLLPASQIHCAEGRDTFFSELVLRVQPDAIFHLASIHVEPKTLDEMMAMVETNVRVGTALLYGASQCEKRPVFINTGSYWQYTENEQYSPRTFYAATKQAFHDLMLYFSSCQDVRAMTLVLYDSFGLDDVRPKLWTKLLHAPSGSRFPLTEGRQYIELVHVEDIARAFLHAAQMLFHGEGLNGSYAVRSEERVTLREMLERWHRKAGLDLELEWGAIPYWSGQVFHPWRGEMLPGWYPRLDVHTVVAEWLRDGRKVVHDEGAN
jgi:nucleoside-diphosphate-sugar epimerase